MEHLQETAYAFLLLQIFIVGIAAWITPGPNMFAVMSASLSQGRKTGIITGFGIATGGVFWAIATVAGVKIIFTAFPFVELGLRLVGGGYLIWLGINALRQSAKTVANGVQLQATTSTGWRAFRSGFLVMATNPKAALYFSSVLAAFVPVNAPWWFLAAIVAVNAIIGYGGQTITATVFSTALARNFFERSRRKISAIFGMMFCGFGLGILYDAARR